MAKSFDDGNGLKIVNSQAIFDKMLLGLTQLAKTEVLVGFPESTTEQGRDSVRDKGITNAALAYIHDNGMPEQNIPARPFMLPGVTSVQDAITDRLVVTMKAVSHGKELSVVEKGLIGAGQKAVDGIKAKITEGIPPPLAPSTIQGRARSRGTKGRRDAEEQYMHLQGQGIDEDFLQGALGIIPLINTGAMRDAVTFVIRERSKRSK